MSNTTAWVFALFSILLSASAQLLMKIGMSGPVKEGGIVAALLNLHVIGGLACYGVSAILWLGALSKIPLSVAYPLVGLAISLVVLGSWLWLGEILTPSRLFGIAFIVIGVCAIGAGSFKPV
jgi:multidrug transporter EmrE-like cation transporter